MITTQCAPAARTARGTRFLSHRYLRMRGGGFTLVELMITVAIVTILAAVAIPSYTSAMNKSRTTVAKRDLVDLQMRLDRYFTQRNTYPATLDDIAGNLLDPWDNPYQYLSMENASVGKKRKDKSLHPLNTDYDLYSMGPDGRSVSPLTAKASRDDIIRANNGGFIGVAEDY